MKVHAQNIYKSFDVFPALEGVTVTIESGDLMALLGPSGSGKTTLLRVIAGLEFPESGHVEFGDRDITYQAVQNRNVGFVFQQYALFPHMTVSQNIGFGLRVKHSSPFRIKTRVGELIDLMQLDGLNHRLPIELSGGQQQRVALARALAPDPAVLLLDEPFGALDANVRNELRHWLRHLHNTINTTTIFVTHDQSEAFEVADSVAILNKGKLEQMGSPSDIYDYPVNAFVMNFIGNNNILHGYLIGKKGFFGDLTLPHTHSNCNRTPAIACIRSQDIILSTSCNGLPHFKGVVTDIRRIGIDVKVTLRTYISESPLTIETSHTQWLSNGFDLGSNVVASIRHAKIFPTNR